jgi:hypothetical protein
VSSVKLRTGHSRRATIEEARQSHPKTVEAFEKVIDPELRAAGGTRWAVPVTRKPPSARD